MNGALYLLAAYAVCNLVVSLVRLASTGDGRVNQLRLGIEIAVAIIAPAVAWRRRTTVPRASGRLAVVEAPVDAPQPARPLPVWFRRARLIVVPLLIALAAISVAGQWDTVSDGVGRLAHLHWHWVRYALYAEALSILAYAWLALALLRTHDGRRMTLGRLTLISLAGNAMANTVPGGPAWAAAFCFGQFRRYGVTRRRASLVLAVVIAVSALSLITLAALGVLVAGDRGPASSLRWVAVAVLVLLAFSAYVVRRPGVRARCVRIGGWCIARLPRRVRPNTGGVAVATLKPREVIEALTASLGNWLADCGCLVLSIVAVGGHVPWSGLLVVYGVTQLAVNLPITPGGIGVVEGTLSLLLVAYHIPAATAVAAVLLYRIISFWVLVPLGWAAAGALVWQGRREAPEVAAPVIATAPVAPTAPAPRVAA